MVVVVVVRPSITLICGKIELENRDFRKSLYFYIVDAGEKRKNGLRVGAGIILNQDLTYIVHTGKNMGCGRLPAP